MEDPLRTYLHDHLAGSGFAVELLKTLQQSYPDHETGAFAGEILNEVREDRETLEHIIQEVGKSHLDLKDATTWLAEKASRVKLRHDNPVGMGAFEALETLGLGILGKRGLWRALAEISQIDPRLDSYDFDALIASSEAQYAKVESYRLRLARSAFQPMAA